MAEPLTGDVKVTADIEGVEKIAGELGKVADAAKKAGEAIEGMGKKAGSGSKSSETEA